MKLYHEYKNLGGDGKFVAIEGKVFNSDENTIQAHDNDGYGGCHVYEVVKCKGFIDGKTAYENDTHYPNGDEKPFREAHIRLQFVHKYEDGSVTPGLQNEQLYLVCLDRLVKMNKKYPDPRNDEMMKHLRELLDLCKQRVEDRISRGVMGDLKK